MYIKKSIRYIVVAIGILLLTSLPVTLSARGWVEIQPVYIPIHHTDASIAVYGKNNGHLLKAKAKGKINSIPNSYFQNLAKFSPDEISSAMWEWPFMVPAYYGDYFSSDITWASESLYRAYADTQYAFFIKKSVILKILVQSGEIFPPDSSTVLVYRWSGAPTSVIGLSFPLWTSADIPELKKLVNNRYYGEWAKYILKQLGQ